MDLELEGDQLYMRGPIGTDDWVKYREISKDKAIRRIVLVKSYTDPIFTRTISRAWPLLVRCAGPTRFWRAEQVGIG